MALMRVGNSSPLPTSKHAALAAATAAASSQRNQKQPRNRDMQRPSQHSTLHAHNPQQNRKADSKYNNKGCASTLPITQITHSILLQTLHVRCTTNPRLHHHLPLSHPLQPLSPSHLSSPVQRRLQESSSPRLLFHAIRPSPSYAGTQRRDQHITAPDLPRWGG